MVKRYTGHEEEEEAAFNRSDTEGPYRTAPPLKKEKTDYTQLFSKSIVKAFPWGLFIGAGAMFAWGIISCGSVREEESDNVTRALQQACHVHGGKLWETYPHTKCMCPDGFFFNPHLVRVSQGRQCK